MSFILDTFELRVALLRNVFVLNTRIPRILLYCESVKNYARALAKINLRGHNFDYYEKNTFIQLKILTHS